MPPVSPKSYSQPPLGKTIVALGLSPYSKCGQTGWTHWTTRKPATG